MIEFLIEILLQAALELLAELGLRSVTEPFRKPTNPWLAAIGYAVFGFIAGGISIWLFPSNFVVGETWRLANLLVTPVAVGAMMSALGYWRGKRGQVVLRIDRFSFGFLFAFSLALIRYWLAK
jgi:hypothetical protein